MSSPWNPNHWRKYNKKELEKFRRDLKRNAENGAKGQDYRQWIREIDTILQPGQQSNPNQIA
jgi:hypothetical protein